MTGDSTSMNTLEELRTALDMAHAATPPPGLDTRVMATALRRRPAHIPVDQAPAISPVEAYRQAVASLDATLGQLHDEQWHLPTIRDLDVQALVGHLIGVEEHLHLALGLGPDGVSVPEDHIASTDPVALAQRGRPPQHTRQEWRTLTDRTLEHLWGARHDVLQVEVRLHGIVLPVGSMLTVRAFELWIHEEDIRRATGQPLVAPGRAALQLMTGLALDLLPAGVAMAGRDVDGRSARIVLTGAGGGVWEKRFGPACTDPIAVRIVADAVSFCRLVANRVDPATFPADISGDDTLARDVFAGAAALALD